MANQKAVYEAVYAGSFDPPTLGHQWMIEQAASMFDEVIVAIGVNPGKKTTFTIDERMHMLEKMTFGMANVTVASFENQYLVNYAAGVGAEFVIRGVRNISDFTYELGMQKVNTDLNPNVSTVFLAPPRHLSEVSSSLVKGLMGPKGWERVVPKYVPDVVLRQMIGKRYDVWERFHEFGIAGTKWEFWNGVLEPYMFSDRHYHDWRHIVEMLDLFNEVRHLADGSVSIDMAILFHDIVYDTTSNKNEEMSAGLAKSLIGHFYQDAGFLDRVSSLIMVTRHDPKAPPQTNDEKILVDLDMAILGAPLERFDEYEAGIREEYRRYSDKDFANGRAKILQSFLDRGDQLYYTDYFREKFLSQAQENLRYSIAKLMELAERSQ